MHLHVFEQPFSELTCNCVVSSCERGECFHVPQEDGGIQSSTGNHLTLFSIRQTSISEYERERESNH